MATIQALAARGIDVHVVHWDHKKITPFNAEEVKNIHVYKRSELSIDQLIDLAKNIEPTITVVSGWMDKGYLAVAKQLKIKGVCVVMGLDGQWHGTLRQWVAVLIGRIGFYTQFFSHAWVAGLYQFEYARKLGFKKKNIIYNLYSADLEIFAKAYIDSFDEKIETYPHRFLFVGRLESIKGLHTLVNAWKLIGEKKSDWELHLIGNGSLKSELEATKGLVIKDFLQPDRLVQEVASAGCFILPSHGEPWGVVVHEFAAAGLPLIVSDAVGSASTFLISGFNGFSFKSNDPKGLAARMLQIISMNDQELQALAVNSHLLSQRITPGTSAANLLSVTN